MHRRRPSSPGARVWRTAAWLASLAVALSFGVAPARGARTNGSLPLRHVVDVRLPGSASRFDYQDIDASRQELFIAHLGDNQVDAVDLRALGVAGVVRGVSEVHGVRVAPDLGVVYASATSANTVVAIDSSTHTIRFRAPTGEFPDGLAYDPDDHVVFVSDKDAGSVSALDATTGRPIRTIKIADETGNVAYDRVSRTMFVAARTPDRLAAIDPRTGAVTTEVELPGCEGAHGVFVEPMARLAFVACERNARLSLVDLADMRPISSSRVGAEPDVLAYDAGLHRLYVASESGVVAVFELRGSSLAKLGQATFADHAHSVAVDQATHRVFFPLEDVKGQPVLRVMRPTGE